jgi:hypothetical protein
LNKARRDYIIANFNLGKEDPEYQCSKLSNGSYRVSKRKSYYSPTANVDNTAGNTEVPMTWMNLQTQMNESLHKDIHRLRKKYEKLADKYETKQTAPPAEVPKPKPIVADTKPIVPAPEKPKPIVPTKPVRAPPRAVGRRKNPITYAKRGHYDVRDF